MSHTWTSDWDENPDRKLGRSSHYWYCPKCKLSLFDHDGKKPSPDYVGLVVTKHDEDFEGTCEEIFIWRIMMS